MQGIKNQGFGFAWLLGGAMVVCKGCEKRHTGCHSTCPDYIACRTEKDRTNEIIKKKKQVETDLISTAVKRSLKIKGRRKK